jgi:diguanylate cyclase (GGDEF)-like protein
MEPLLPIDPAHLPVLSLAAAQTVTAAVLARLLFHLYRDYDRDYLLHWAWSWVSLAILQVAVAGVVLVTPEIGPSHPFRLLLSVVGGAAGYLHFGWLAFGAWELARRRAAASPGRRRILMGLAVAGSAMALAFPSELEVFNDRSGLQYGPRTFISAAAFLYAGIEVWRTRTRNISFGLKLVSVTFGLLGLNRLHTVAAAMLPPNVQMAVNYPQLIYFADFVLLTLVGVGMIGLLLDDERELSVQATVEIEHLAYHDALTSLPNRLLFMDRLEVAIAQAQRYEQKLAVLVIDLDRFKEINDSLGHSAGDALLQQVTDRIRHCVRQSDTVARLGGDEFGVVVQKIEGFEDAAKVAQKIIDAMDGAYIVSEREIGITGSIGISIYPHDGHNAESLVKNADTAMYRAKDQNRGTYRFYEPAMNARALERLALENSLRKALAGQELVLFYQPLVDLRTQKVNAFEALLRWNHPELGLLLPGRFIHAAEISGLIVPIGAWVLRTAFAQAKHWQRRAPGVGLSCNLSARQFQQADIVETVRLALEESGLDPKLVELEITETHAMHDAEQSIRKLEQLKELGVRISMDDFGTGYSSLSYLKKFPIDILKLDRSFVRDIVSDSSDGAIATAVIAMAHSLSLKVVAEGVETRGQLAFLRDRACDRIQGFFFSPPLSPSEFDIFIDQRSHLAWQELREMGEIRPGLSH